MNLASRLLLLLALVSGGIYLYPICCAAPGRAQTSAVNYFVAPHGRDTSDGTSPATAFATIQKALQAAGAGTTVTLAPGIYDQDLVSVRSGRLDAPIIITGPKEAVVTGGGADRIIEINHDYLVLSGFTVDGLHGPEHESTSYRDKLIYLLGRNFRRGVTGVKILGLTLKNAGGECIRLRYFAQQNVIAANQIVGCGRYDFLFGSGGKNGEGIYIGTAPEQLGDGKNPTSDTDTSDHNWIHHNTIETQGNECVDIKEGASRNLIESNSCTGQKDPESGGFASRGNYNIFRLNTVFKNTGAGIRLGGDEASDGTYNDVYENTLSDNLGGGLKIQRSPQGTICGNEFSANRGGLQTGKYKTPDPARACPPEISSSATPVASTSPLSLLSPPPVLNPAPVIASISPRVSQLARAYYFLAAVWEKFKRWVF